MSDSPTFINGDTFGFDLSGNDRGNIQIKTEKYNKRQRPKKIMGTLRIPGTMPSRDKNLKPLSVPDDEEWKALLDASFEGGHLIALGFGGPDHAVNIVPMNKGANGCKGVWGQIEQCIGNHLSLAKATGGTIQIELTLTYPPDDPRIPCRVSGWIKRILVQGQVQNEVTINHAISPPTDCTFLKDEHMQLFNDIEQLAREKGSATLMASPERPNAPLDVVDYKNDPDSRELRIRIRKAHPALASYPLNGFRKKKKERARPQQRILLFLYNRYRNRRNKNIQSGILTAEDGQNLGLPLREWQGQYDHSRARKYDGTNHYGNLVLTHHRTNNLRGADGTLSRNTRARQKPHRFQPY
ncbi:hypothetical protein F0U61_20125 [Archangium violaceum]|uniref:DNA/RNA non-specific endonuclease n=1 Tax=Archangium violaceum TaxID=83451 RepID=UPI002B2E1A7B|nr:hypothetical protein F0U61_20125 [Archangium violaceum]